MKITSGSVTLTLVDPAISDFQPIPAASTKQLFDSYHIEGGATKYVPHGVEEAGFKPQVVLIEQASDALAQTQLNKLRQIVANKFSQPVQIQWDDYNLGGTYDGDYWLSDIGTAEVSSEFQGRIEVSLNMIPVNPPTALAGALGAAPAGHQKNDLLVGAEPWLDFIDTTGITWTVTDDSSNSRVRVSGTVNRANWRGVWNSATVYAVGDEVSYSGSSYVAIVANTNHAPPNPTYWGVVSQGSSQVAAWRHTGPPIAADGTYASGQWGFDTSMVLWVCTAAGTPGTWKTAMMAYRARAHSYGQTIAFNAETAISLASVDYDPNGNFNTGTGLYTLPVAGYYDVKFQVRFQASAAGRIRAGLIINGAVREFAEGSSSGNGAIPSAFGVDCLLFAAGDTLGLSAYHTLPAATALQADGIFSNFLAVHYRSAP